MRDIPKSVKHITVWLLLATALFLGVQAWMAQQRAARISLDMPGVIELRRGPDGHYHWPGTINGRQVDFLVDTGATRTALPQALAEGLQSLGAVRSSTAGGVVQGHVVRADIVLQGGVRANALPVTVLPQLGAPLLGMDVLGKLHYSQADGVLRFEAPR